MACHKYLITSGGESFLMSLDELWCRRNLLL